MPRHRRVGRVDGARITEMHQRLGTALHSREHHSSAVVCLEVARVEPDCMLQLGKRFGVLAEGHVGGRQACVQLGLTGIVGDRIATRVPSSLSGLGFEAGRRHIEAGDGARVTRGAQQNERCASESRPHGGTPSLQVRLSVEGTA
jgi:hypothetical protein